MINQDTKIVSEELIEHIKRTSSGSYLIEGNKLLNNKVTNNISNRVKTDYFLFEVSCKSLKTDSYSFVKKLVSPYVALLQTDNPALLVEFKQSLCLLMPYLKKNSLFEDVILGLDVPREENPTSFTMSFITTMLNGIINFLLAAAKYYAADKPVMFILQDVDQCDFSSLHFINRLTLRSSVCSYHVILSSSKIDVLDFKGINFTKRHLFNQDISIKNTSKKDIDKIDLREQEFILAEYIANCCIEKEEINLLIYQNTSKKEKYKYHKKQIEILKNEENDLSSKYAKLIFHLEAISEKAIYIKEILINAAYYSRISGYYDEAVYYVTHCQKNYWSSFNNEEKAKLLRIKGVGHIRLKENNEALESLNESLKLAKDPYFRARLCYTIGSFVIKHDDNQLGPAWLRKGFKQIEGLDNNKATLERLWLNNSKALIEYRNKNYNEAIRIEKENLVEFNKSFDAQSHDVTHAILHYNTAYVLQDSGRLDEALTHIEEGIRLVPSNLDLYNNKANILQLKGNYHDALAYYDKLKNPGYPKVEVYINCGNAYMKLNEYELALENYNYAISLVPENSIAWNARGHVKYLQGDYELAINDFTEALNINSNYPSALINRANAFTETGKIQAALQDYTQAEKINPGLVEIYINRAVIFQEINNLERAKEDLEYALSLSSQNYRAYIYVNLAIIFSENKDMKKSKEYLDLAVKHNPLDPWIRFNKAHLHLELNEIALAHLEINKALEISPATKEFLELKNKIKELELV